ncbi:hypothetical protein ACOSQ3_020574 [Xanthoceras sorbifolium]
MAEAATLIVSGRNAPPSHYLIKIESFSILKASIKTCISDEFDAGGYKWKFCIYPTGNRSRNGKDHVSIYLELVQTNAFPNGWELLNLLNLVTYFYTWKVTKFSTLVEEKFVSESFGHYKNVLLCPDGNGRGKGNCISIFLEVPRSSIPADTKLFLKYILRVKDQKNGKHIYTEGNELFASNKAVLGLPEFLSLAKLRDPKMGYLVDDTLIIEAEVTLLGLVLPKS